MILVGSRLRNIKNNRREKYVMIPTIGLMIGLYILARYCEIYKTGYLGLKIIVALFAFITIGCIISLLVGSANTPSLPFAGM